MKKLFFILLFISLSSCSNFLSKKYGIENIESFDESKYQQIIKGIDFKNIVYYSTHQDSAAYECMRNKVATNQLQVKDMSQPIQLYYFNRDSLTSFQANCYVRGGVSNLNWNTLGRFNVSPPTSAVDLDEFSVSKEQLRDCIQSLDNIDTSTNVIFIYWTTMFNKISQDAIKVVIDNVVTHNQQNNTIIYLINNDPYFSKMK